MNKNKFLKYQFLFLLVLFFSCRNKSLETIAEPANLLSREKVAGILADMHLSEAALQIKTSSPDTLKALSAGYNKFIFEKHGVDSEQFVRSFDYYLSNSLQMDTVMSFVVDTLSKQEALSRGVLQEPVEVMPLPENK